MERGIFMLQQGSGSWQRRRHVQAGSNLHVSYKVVHVDWTKAEQLLAKAAERKADEAVLWQGLIDVERGDFDSSPSVARNSINLWLTCKSNILAPALAYY